MVENTKSIPSVPSVDEKGFQSGLIFILDCVRGMTPTYILFNKRLEDLRRIGARGGKANGRNQRARRVLLTPRPPTQPVEEETAAEAIALLDAQFPWLRGAEKRTVPRRQPSNSCCGQHSV
jgi:hypothetical protein